MKSILNPVEKNEIIERIEKLTSESKPLWGKMNVLQMLEHCTTSVKLALGEIKPELIKERLEFGIKAKPRVFETEEFGKSLPTSKEFLEFTEGDFDSKKSGLIYYINYYSNQNPESEVLHIHPILGDLNVKEWGILIRKHTNHHLEQFGV